MSFLPSDGTPQPPVSPVQVPETVSIYRVAVLLHRAGLITLKTSSGDEAFIRDHFSEWEDVAEFDCDWVKVRLLTGLLNEDLCVREVINGPDGYQVRLSPAR